MKSIHGGVLLLVKLQAKVCSFTKSNTPAWALSSFFKLYKWFQIAQSITYNGKSVMWNRFQTKQTGECSFFPNYFYVNNFESLKRRFSKFNLKSNSPFIAFFAIWNIWSTPKHTSSFSIYFFFCRSFKMFSNWITWKIVLRDRYCCPFNWPLLFDFSNLRRTSLTVN